LFDSLFYFKSLPFCTTNINLWALTKKDENKLKLHKPPYKLQTLLVNLKKYVTYEENMKKYVGNMKK